MTTHTPPAGTYDLDPGHTSAGFSVRHLGLSKVRGHIPVTSGTVTVADIPERSTVEVVLDPVGITTGAADRDAHLRSPDFLDVDEHPTMEYRSTAVRRDGDRWLVDGDLTVRGVTRPVTLTVTFDGTGQDPWGGTRAAFSAAGEFDREDFGLTWNQALETGGVLVGKTVTVTVDAQAVLR